MRKPVTIETDKAGILWNRVLLRANWLDVCDKCIRFQDGIVMLKNVAKKIVQDVVKDSEEAGKELGIETGPEEMAAIKYLKSVL